MEHDHGQAQSGARGAMFEEYESHTIYTPSLSSDPVVVDLGAHRGEFSREMHARYGGTYYLVEANPVLADALRTNGSFRVWHCAVADVEGSIQFNIAQNATGSSILELPKESAYGCVLQESVSVQARTLESLLAEIKAPRIDILKMDIEGAEVKVLPRLSAATLAAIGQITVEFHSDPIFGFGLHEQVEAIIKAFRRRGFVCLDFSGGSREDMLFINRAVHQISWLKGLVWEFRTTPPKWLSRVWAQVPAVIKTSMRRAMNRATIAPPHRD